MEWLETIASSALIVGLLKLIEIWLNNRLESRKAESAREEAFKHRYYTELKQEIDALKVRLQESEAKTDQWQTKYYELLAQYRALEVQSRADERRIQALEREIQSLKQQIQGATTT